jgi:hypothetical protein
MLGERDGVLLPRILDLVCKKLATPSCQLRTCTNGTECVLQAMASAQKLHPAPKSEPAMMGPYECA